MDSTYKHFELGIFESAQLLNLLQNQLVVVPLKPLSLEVNLLTEAEEYLFDAQLSWMSYPMKSLTSIEAFLLQLLLFSFTFLVAVDELGSSTALWSA